MSIRTHLIAAASVAVIASATHAGVLVGPIVNPANNHTYYLLTQNGWTASEAEALTLGGHLATINEGAEQAWVQSTFADNRNLWIGLHNPSQNPDPATHAATYGWASGGTSSFRNWSPNEPNNIGFEHWVHTWGDATDMAVAPAVRAAGTWNNIIDSGDYPGSVHQPFGVVEVVPEPASLAAGLAIAGVAVRRRRQ